MNGHGYCAYCNRPLRKYYRHQQRTLLLPTGEVSVAWHQLCWELSGAWAGLGLLVWMHSTWTGTDWQLRVEARG